MKKFVALVLAAMMLLAACALAEPSVSTTADSFELTGDPAAIKIGVVLIGDENEGYSYAHIDGVTRAAANLGLADDQLIFKYNTSDTDNSAYDACADLVDSGCNLIFTNSYGHQSPCLQAAIEFPEAQFVAMTGDMANANMDVENYANTFNRVYESRYMSGVVAGVKLNEMIEKGELSAENYDENGNIKVGYVGAFPYAEVVSGYTAFFLGVRSQCPTVAMTVTYTNSWSDIIAESEAANMLIGKGCAIISQHSDTTGPASATQAAKDAGKNVYCVGYNISMLSVAPTACLTSASADWSVYYTYAIKTAINGERIARNWAGGYTEGAVRLTELGESAVVSDIYDETIAKIAAGELKVFDTATFTVGGETVTSAFATDSDGDWTNDCDEAIIDGAYNESYFQSAPSFSLRIDGITELN